MTRYARRYPRVVVANSQYCALTAVGLPCVHGGAGRRHDACEIMGPRPPMSLERARHYAVAQVRDPALAEQVAQYMALFGGCVWHACAEIQGSPTCSCAPCRDPLDPRHPWLVDSRRIAAEQRMAVQP